MKYTYNFFLIFCLFLFISIIFYKNDIIIQKAMAKNIQNSSVVFMYHRFGESKHPSTNVSIEQFKSHLEEFSKSKYNVATLNFIVDSFSAETSLPKNTIAIIQ